MRALPVADEAEHKRVPRSKKSRKSVSPKMGGKVIGIYNHSERFFFRRRLEPAIILCVYGRFHNARMEKKIR